MSILTLYCNNPSQLSAGLLTPTQPTASTSTTGWTVGTVVAGSYASQEFSREAGTSRFDTTVKPTNTFPWSSATDCWRISAITTGNFSTGTWYSSLSVIAVTSGGDQSGRARFRLWRSANGDGTTATELTKGTMVGTTITNLATTVAQSSSASTSIAAFSLTNEYLFMQVAWEITGAGTVASRDVLVRLGSMAQTNGSGLVTGDFAPAAGGAVFGGMMMPYYINLVQDSA